VVESNPARVHPGVVTHNFHNEDKGSKSGSELREIHRCVSLFGFLIIAFNSYLHCIFELSPVSTRLCLFVGVGTL
jgi:hypothetical protein